MTISVAVCGGEYFTSTWTTPYFQFLTYESADRSTLTVDERYFAIAQADFAAWWTLSPTGTICVVDSYTLLSNYTYDSATGTTSTTVWDDNVYPEIYFNGTFAGSDHHIQVDRTVNGYNHKFWLMAKSLGQITAAREIEFALCATDCFAKTATYHEDLSYIVPKASVTLGVGTTIR